MEEMQKIKSATLSFELQNKPFTEHVVTPSSNNSFMRVDLHSKAVKGCVKQMFFCLRSYDPSSSHPVK